MLYGSNNKNDESGNENIENDEITEPYDFYSDKNQAVEDDFDGYHDDLGMNIVLEVVDNMQIRNFFYPLSF